MNENCIREQASSRPVQVFRSILAGLLLTGMATKVSAEDCLSFVNSTVVVKQDAGAWRLNSGKVWFLNFGTNLNNANLARDRVKHYGYDQVCLIGANVTTNPFIYFKKSGAFVAGNIAGQDAAAFNFYNVSNQLVSGTWRTRDCNNQVWDFGANGSAAAAELSSLMRTHSLRTLVYIGGRVTPGMTYFLPETAWRPSTTLLVTGQGQEMNMWCWAATSSMILRWYGISVSQCALANERFSRTDCCAGTRCPAPGTGTAACNIGGWPDIAFNNRGILYSRTTSAAISWETLWSNISCSSRPVGVTWAWVGGGGHIMVANGVRIGTDGTRFVSITDPLAVCRGSMRWITYEAYVSLAGQYTHWDDFFNIRRS